MKSFCVLVLSMVIGLLVFTDECLAEKKKAEWKKVDDLDPKADGYSLNHFISRTDVSSDGEYFAFAVYTDETAMILVYKKNKDSWGLAHSIPSKGGCSGLAIGGGYVVWYSSTEFQLFSLKTEKVSGFSVQEYALDFTLLTSDDGGYTRGVPFLATVGQDRMLRVFDSVGNQLGSVVAAPDNKGRSNSVAKIDAAPGGKVIATASRRGIVSVWKNGAVVPTVNLSFSDPGRKDVTSLRVSQDGSMIAVGQISGNVYLYDAKRRTKRKLSPYTWRGNSVSISSMDFSSDGKILAVYGGETIDLFDTDSGKLVTQLPVFGMFGLRFSADGTLFFPHKGAIQVWRQDPQFPSAGEVAMP